MELFNEESSTCINKGSKASSLTLQQKITRSPSLQPNHACNKSTSSNILDHSTNKPNQLSQKEIASQLAPEKFSKEDVQYLQRELRKLHSENIQKTLSYLKLEQEFYSLKDKVSTLKRENENLKTKLLVIKPSFPAISTQQNQCRIQEEPQQEFKKAPDRIIEDSENLLVAFEEKFKYFEEIIHHNKLTLENNLDFLNNGEQKIHRLEREVFEWKERCKKFEALIQDYSPEGRRAGRNSMQIEDNLPSCSSNSAKIERQSKKPTPNNSFYHCLAPKANNCFNSVKAALFRCPNKVPSEGDEDENFNQKPHA